MSYSVTLILPNLCEDGDWQDGKPTPVDAVEAFTHSVTGSPDLWTYGVREEGGERRQFIVDMADGPSVKEGDAFEPLDNIPLGLSKWCVARLQDSRESGEVDEDVTDAVIEREAARLEVLCFQLASSFVDNEFNEKE
jgi:hypothetical protein